mmetsp:Transcript_19977/g.58991  ORF Transcript_19977/g.58991 Transcript_19977/m.58991 type:complete len:311 (-) Transcript_19977:244-1176(-)
MILSITFYMVASAGMSIFNKLAVMNLPLPLTIVVLQMVFTVASLGCSPSVLRYGSADDLRRWSFTVPPLFVGMLASSMLAMQFSTLGTIVVCRNVAPIFTMLIEGMFRIPFVSTAHTILSLITIVAGVAIYEANDLKFSFVGTGAIMVNMVFAVLERIMQRHLMSNSPVDMSKPMMMMLNNAIGSPPTLVLAMIWGEHSRWGSAFGALSLHGVAYLIISCLNGLAISYAGIRLQHMVAATTFMVITNVNKFAVIFFGILAFNETATPMSIMGCSLAILGGVYYAEARKRADAERAAHKAGQYSKVGAESG